MSDPRSGQDKLESLQTYLDSLTGSPETALRQLEGKVDADSVRRTLSILLDNGRYRDAADLVLRVTPRAEWCDKGVLALAMVDEVAQAKKLMEQSRVLDEQDALPGSPGRVGTWRRCICAYVEGRYTRVLRGHPDGEPIALGTLNDEEKAGLLDIAAVLQPIVDLVRANRLVQTELESVGLQFAIRCYAFLGDHVRAQELAELLNTRSPIVLLLPELALSALVPAKEDWPQRLREEHPDEFRAQVLAAFIEGEVLGKEEAAFAAAVKLSETASSDQDKEGVCKLITQMAGILDSDEAWNQAERIARSLLPTNSRLLRLIQVQGLLRKRNGEAAKTALADLADERDPFWLQLYAHSLILQGDKDKAGEYLAKAAALHPHPSLLKQAAALAFSNKQLKLAAEHLEKVLTLDPEDAAARHNAALVYMKLGDHDKASEHLKVLYEHDPGAEANGLNYANSLVLMGKVDDAIKVYDAMCKREHPPLAAVLKRAQLLKGRGEPKKAYAALVSAKEQYWDNAVFVGQVLDLSYAADEEAMGHAALVHMRELQVSGKAGPDILQQKTLDDLKEYAKNFAKSRDLTDDNILSGRMPWLMADELMGKASYWGWFVRTQTCSWIGDDPRARAEFSIYATNGFTVGKGLGQRTVLEELSCVPRGTKVVMDMSALLTLDRLGLLDQAVAYFGQVVLPISYMARSLEESSKLLPHQLSRKNAFGEIEAVLNNRTIRVLDDPGTPGNRPMAYVDEHTMPEDHAEHYYRLRDLLAPLAQAGRIDDTKRKEMLSVPCHPEGADGDHPALCHGDSILVALSSLTSLHQFGLLKPVIDAFRVHITEADKNEVLGELRAWRAGEEVWQWHQALWDRVRKDDRFVKEPWPKSGGPSEEVSKNLEDDTSVAAALLTKDLGLPLIADDRVSQVLVLNENKGNSSAAFGTDKLLVALQSEKSLPVEEIANAFLTLIAWRYRFVLVPHSILKTLLDRFKSSPPGEDLRRVAYYVHDCMRDPGLFAGLERSEPPITMANRLFVAWCDIVGDLIVDVWLDPSYEEEAARLATEWAVTELLPSPPRNMGGIRRIIGAIGPQLVISKVVMRAYEFEKTERANKALATVADALGITQEEYLRYIEGVLHEF